jgi:alkylation response protein AidB-like acyl-CoA dehydrogenase
VPSFGHTFPNKHDRQQGAREMATGLSATAFEALKAKLWGFMQAEIYPNEQLFAAQSKAIGEASHDWHWPPILLELKRKAKAQGLWNLFLPVDSAAAAGIDQRVLGGGGLTNRQYAEICEIMGTSCHAEFAAMACNCASPDTGNMEVLANPNPNPNPKPSPSPSPSPNPTPNPNPSSNPNPNPNPSPSPSPSPNPNPNPNPSQVLARYGTAEQKRHWLVPLLEGRIRSCFAMTEPGVASSDATNIGISIARDEARGPNPRASP